MKLELLIIAVTLFFIVNTYLDGKLFQFMKQGKKYYQYSILCICRSMHLSNVKKESASSARSMQKRQSICKNICQSISNTQDMLMPIIDFTKSSLDTVQQGNTNLGDSNNNYLNNYQNLTPNQRRVLSSGTTSALSGKTKRSVSETKKKYVASEQNWRCKHCSIKLPAWFEVDHVVKLEYGGSNSIDNLEALCRDCHGKKTAMENL